MAEDILVTGATGFTGGYLARELQRRGHRVRALVRPSSNKQPLVRSNIEPVEGELVNSADVRRAVKGLKTVYHIAAAYREAKHPDSYYFGVNVGGTQNVLEAARAEGIDRVVHCSTMGVHGAVETIPANESSPFKPGDVYQRSKLEGELLVQQAIEKGQPAVIFRPAGIYGPGDHRFLKLFKAVHNGTFRMFGSGDVMYHHVYIDDLVPGILLCGERQEALGHTFILAGPRYVTLNELVTLIGEAVERPVPRRHLPLWPLVFAATVCEFLCRPFRIEPPLHRRRCDFFIKHRAFSGEKAKSLLGFEPKIDLAEGLKRTAASYFESGLLKRKN